MLDRTSIETTRILLDDEFMSISTAPDLTEVDGPGTGRDDRSSVDKAIAILTAFGPYADTGIGVSQLARRASLNKSTAFRVLHMLERNGVVEKTGREYRLGARLHDLGRAVYPPAHDAVRDQLIPFVTELYEATHETVHLAALHGTDVVYLAKLYGHRQVKSPSRIGARVPAYPTAVGKAILAFDADGLELTMARDLVALTSATVGSHDELRRQLAEVRQAGIAIEREEVTPGLACLAAPVLNATGRPVAAISVSASPGRLDRRTFEPLLRRIAAEASRSVSRRRVPAIASTTSASVSA